MKKYIFITFSLIFLQSFTCFTSDSTDKKENTQIESKPLKQPKNIQQMDSSVNKYTDLNKDAFNLHYNAVVIDTHNDILMPVMIEGADMTREMLSTQSDFVKWKKGGIDVQVFSIYVPEKVKKNDFKYSMGLIDKLEQIQWEYPDELYLAKNYEELIRRVNEGKFCGLMGAEGGNMIEGSMENLESLFNRGVRYLGLTWNTSNAIGVSAKDETTRGKTGGLTDFGKEVVKRMDEMGMMIDVSHLGETAFWDVVNLSKNPIIASHSNVYNICPHYRNLNDEQIKAIAESGGIVCINFYYKFLDPGGSSSQTIQNRYKRDLKEIEKNCNSDYILFNEKRYEYLSENPAKGGTSVDILIDHIDYIVKLVGVDYVGLGSDFDGSINTPNELYDATCYPIITKKLAERGYKEEEIRKILGLNFLRVFKKVCG